MDFTPFCELTQDREKIKALVWSNYALSTLDHGLVTQLNKGLRVEAESNKEMEGLKLKVVEIIEMSR